MNIIPPIDVTDATLTSSNVPENDYTEWNPATAYVVGNKAMYATTMPDVHRNYECLVDNTNIDPFLDQTLTGGTNWLDIGPTNTWAMFDNSNGTQTTRVTPIDVTLTMGEVVNTVAVLNTDARTVQVIVTDPIDGVVYDTTKILQSTSGINNWYAYYFTAISFNMDVIFLDLPSYPNADIQVIISGEVAIDVSVGVLVVGVQKLIGTTDHGTGISIIDYSVKSTDSFGNFTITQRGFSKRAEYVVTVNTNDTSDIQNFLSSIRTTPVVWIGNEDFGATIVYGYYRDFDIVLSSPQSSDCNIVVEGLT